MNTYNATVSYCNPSRGKPTKRDWTYVKVWRKGNALVRRLHRSLVWFAVHPQLTSLFGPVPQRYDRRL